MNPYLSLFIGVVCAAAGGECFVKGSVGLARWARIPAAIIGATIAAFATSSPELTVAISSARSGTPEISLGDALGSNIVNVAVILAIGLLFGNIKAERETIRRDFIFAVIQPLLLALLSLDGILSFQDGLILLLVFGVWLLLLVSAARRERSAGAELLASRDGPKAIGYSIVGLVLLIAAGKLIVAGAGSIAATWGISAFIVGAVIVAMGTSVPELATMIISRLRGNDELGLGTILGSNIFNGLFIVGVATVIHPIQVGASSVFTSLGFGLIVIVACYPNRSGRIERWRSALLLALYAAFVVTSFSH